MMGRQPQLLHDEIAGIIAIMMFIAIMIVIIRI